MVSRVFIGLGANLNDPVSTIKQAIVELDKIAQTQLVSVSKIYSSSPMGPSDQPDYINAVALLETHLSAHQLFEHTCNIEQLYGRVRTGEHWGPRTLDLDILLYNDQIIDDELLTIPHYGLKEREFVIYPLLDIEPNLTLPCGTIVKSLTKHVPLNGMTAI